MEIIKNKEDVAQRQNNPNSLQRVQTYYSKNLDIVFRPLKLFLTILVIVIILSFFAGLAVNNLPFISSLLPTKNLSLYTNPSLLPTEEGLLRSHSVAVEGEVRDVSGDQITLKAGEDEIIIKLSDRFAEPGSPPTIIATDSSGLNTRPKRPSLSIRPKRPLPEFKVGDTIRAFLEVVDGEALITNIQVVKRQP